MNITTILYLYLLQQNRIATFLIPEELVYLGNDCRKSGATNNLWLINERYLTSLRDTLKAATSKPT